MKIEDIWFIISVSLALGAVGQFLLKEWFFPVWFGFSSIGGLILLLILNYSENKKHRRINEKKTN